MVRRILVADDSSTIQKVIKIGLASLPNEIRSVSSLMEATKVAQPGQFDLIIAGAGLPGVSAAIDFKKLSEQAGKVPVIILMGTYDAVREPELRASEIQFIMKKPFPPGDLTRMVQEALGAREQRSPHPSSVNDAYRVHDSNPLDSQAPVGDVTREWRVPNSPAQTVDRSSISASIPEAIPDDLPFGSVSAFEMSPGEGSEGGNIIPPVPDVEPSRKGRPAFDLGGQPPQSILRSPDLSEASSKPSPAEREGAFLPGQISKSQVTGVSAAVEAFVLNELPPLVDRAVERYCIEHFKQVAREALTSELRRLAEEKARFLVDQ
jgi:CheY-like chemotaxis protein